MVQVNLRRPTVLTLDVGEEQCKGDDIQWLLEEAKKKGGPFDPEQLRNAATGSPRRDAPTRRSQTRKSW